MSIRISRRTFLKGIVAGAALSAERSTVFAEESAATTPLAKRVVMLSLDGIRPDGLAQAKTPNLDRLFRRGVFSHTTLVEASTPTYTLPSWTTLLTGGGKECHGVSSNSWTKGSTSAREGFRDDEGYVPSVFTFLKAQGVKTAFYYNWKELINSYNPKDFDEKKCVADDAYEENFGSAFEFIFAHREERQLIFLYDVHTDHAGHSHGWMSEAYLTAIEEYDAAIGRLLSRLANAGLLADTHFLFLSDHGGHGTGHGSRIPTDEIVPWGIVGPGIRRNALLRNHNTVNNAPILLRLFGVEQPSHWVGRVPEEIFA